jgi:hypothetical protein
MKRAEMTPLYRSPNGDRWFLARDPATGLAFVRHQANTPSGGQVIDIEIGAFLSGPRNPEHEALLRLIGTSILDPQAAGADDEQPAVKREWSDAELNGTDTRLSSADADASTASAHTGAASHERHESFWDWLFGSDVPEHDRGWYHANLREGRTALSVLIHNNIERERVADILEEFNPVHMDDGTETGTAPVSMGAEQGEYAPAGSSQMRASGARSRLSRNAFAQSRKWSFVERRTSVSKPARLRFLSRKS